MKIKAVCPACGGPAPLLDNHCPACHTSLMIRCRECQKFVQLGEPRCSYCQVDHPAQGHPSSRDLELGIDPVASEAHAPPTVPGGFPTPQVPNGPYGAAPPPATPPPARSSSRGKQFATFVTLVAVVTGGVVGRERFLGKDSPSDAPSAQITPVTVPIPAAWDPRIQPLAEFVEKMREGEFLNPVAVEFLPDDQFVEAYRGDGIENVRRGPAGNADSADSADSADGDELNATFGAEMRALGLLPGGVDFGASVDAALSASVTGFYQYTTNRLVVRGTDLNPFVSATVVHELTHAWQDQHFDLSTQEDATDSEAEAGHLALIEGDARRVEDLYIRDLTDGEREEYWDILKGLTDEGEGAATTADDGAQGSFDTVSALLNYPYDFGPAFVGNLMREGGAPALDAAFADPPTSTEQILFPDQYLAHDDPVAVTAPTFADEVVDEDIMGAYGIFLILGNRLGFDRALDAVRGWGGDSFVATRRDLTVCVHLSVVGDTPAETDELGTAFADWAATVEGAAGGRDKDRAFLDACDTGGLASVERPEQVSAVELARARSDLIKGFQFAGMRRAAGECIVDGLRSLLGNDGFIEELYSPVSDAWSAALTQARDSCTPYYPDIDPAWVPTADA